VLDGDRREIGRIPRGAARHALVLDDHRTGPPGADRGYAASREQAMADFKRRWET
jgi:hypothetical protein